MKNTTPKTGPHTGHKVEYSAWAPSGSTFKVKWFSCNLDIECSLAWFSSIVFPHYLANVPPNSARHALNCIITAYHLHEWVWGDWLKTDHATWAKLGIRDKETFAGWLTSHWPGFVTMRDLANGAKNFINSTSSSTGRIDGSWGKGPWHGALVRMHGHTCS